MTVTAERDADAVAITVRDGGSGIPGADRERIFERFEWAGGTW